MFTATWLETRTKRSTKKPPFLQDRNTHLSSINAFGCVVLFSPDDTDLCWQGWKVNFQSSHYTKITSCGMSETNPHLSEISSNMSMSLAAKPRRLNSGATDRAVTWPCHSSRATEPSAFPMTADTRGEERNHTREPIT